MGKVPSVGMGANWERASCLLLSKIGSDATIGPLACLSGRWSLWQQAALDLKVLRVLPLVQLR